jgi:hypothetical protein
MSGMRFINRSRFVIVSQRHTRVLRCQITVNFHLQLGSCGLGGLKETSIQLLTGFRHLETNKMRNAEVPTSQYEFHWGKNLIGRLLWSLIACFESKFRIKLEIVAKCCSIWRTVCESCLISFRVFSLNVGPVVPSAMTRWARAIASSPGGLLWISARISSILMPRVAWRAVRAGAAFATTRLIASLVEEMIIAPKSR